ncbi:type III toxin-antitoxin system CptIN family toxin [Clostridium perfringens]|uniref:type III toxin-antitoxin system CptIN family toxin n=1 Tax=Clostridium perfringens TaxID=1502 RepID=UPI003749C164
MILQFRDKKLMKNKEIINGKVHNRPAYFSFLDPRTNIYWFIPISSQVSKYERIYNNKIRKSPKSECDTIVFGYVLGKKKAFLIQNMCPVTPKYINNLYIDNATGQDVCINPKLKKELTKKAKKVLHLTRTGFDSLIFPDVLSIEKALIEQMQPQI